MENNMKPYKRIITLILAVVMAASLIACTSKPEPIDPNADIDTHEQDSSLPAFINLLPIPDRASTVGVVNTGFKYKVQELYELNDHTIGWLSMPNSENFDEHVMFYPAPDDAPESERHFYLRRDFNRVPNTGPLHTQYGSYYADRRCTFDGGRQGMSRNTPIYGHSMEDDPNGNAFSQLKKYLDEDFARENPYIYFSLIDEDLVWEVFAVFYATTSLPYNRPDQSDRDFRRMIEEVRARSIWNYEANVTTDDKIIGLSTCCYNLSSTYPNDYRFVIMAKLVKDGHATLEEAVFTANPDVRAP